MPTIALPQRVYAPENRQWHYVINDCQCGPIDEEHFRRLLSCGKISPASLVWHKGLKNWTPLSQITPSGKTDTPFTEYAAQESGERVSGIAQGAPWLRFMARMLDVAIFLPLTALMILLLPKSQLLPDMVYAIMMIGLAIFMEALFIIFLAATPGKLLLGMRLLRHDGSHLSLGQALIRTALLWVMGLGLFLSWAVSLAFLWASYRLLRNQGTTFWDHQEEYQVVARPIGFSRAMAASATLSVIVCFTFISIA